MPNKWSIYTAAVGGGFGVPANSLSIWQYPPNQNPGCCLERFTISPSVPGQTVTTVNIDGAGNVQAARVSAETPGDSNALYGYNNSSNYTLFLDNAWSGGGLFFAENLYTGALCIIDSNGTFSCTGGAASAVVPVNGGSRKVALYAVEAPENWFEDFGSGRLSNGEAVIQLESTFVQTVNTGTDYHVFLTPRGECEGLYIAEVTSGAFTVRELHHGASSVSFDYRIVARRKGYENVRLADKTEDFDKNRFKRPTRPETPPPSPQQMRDPHRPIVTPSVTLLSKPVVE
ncbi:hypothetical protein SBA1_500001 [Candidatus Sulfotelmatobacter kueseliae]|uniref:Uncharacterized protein n=1 Tax=Candidatus Sulfotelmatobacter kueseliae TaxID=2042962 RepID=A0A2U3KW44_9BACT|nr:hypothetical protein SBA1_500001 [Candidatus Sulfotelmatobacter kueseliae]